MSPQRRPKVRVKVVWSGGTTWKLCSVIASRYVLRFLLTPNCPSSLQVNGYPPWSTISKPWRSRRRIDRRSWERSGSWGRGVNGRGCINLSPGEHHVSRAINQIWKFLLSSYFIRGWSDSDSLTIGVTLKEKSYFFEKKELWETMNITRRKECFSTSRVASRKKY